MADWTGYSYRDFATSGEVEAVLPHAGEWNRLSLIVWEYALRRAETIGAGRPSRIDLLRYQAFLISSWPIFVALWSLFLALWAAILIASGLSMVEFPFSATDPFTVIPAVIAAVMTVGLSWWLAMLFGAKGRAMRSVWASRNKGTDERLAVLDRAVDLEVRRLAKR